ncbi:MAG: acyl-CoA dehydrogenase [Acidimicrobiales bacterium]|jgi:alkylation response protein AidB-like acyl-CoA dehydrogenase
MGIGIQDEHEELRAAVRGWAEARGVVACVRAALDADEDAVPRYWADLAAQGLLAVHVPEEHGGQGAGLIELAVVAEELGRVAAVGPWDTTAVVAGVISVAGGAGLVKGVLPGLADGSLTATLAVPIATPDGRPVAPAGLTGSVGSDGSVVVHGVLRPLVHGGIVSHALAPVQLGADTRWVLLERGDAAAVTGLASFDLTRPCAAWQVDGAVVGPERILDAATTGLVRDLTLVVLSAEATGGARWCLDTAAEHARTREQFGRPIGQFQGVKHRLANMLVSVEQAVAATWDAAVVLGAESGPSMGDEAAQGSLSVQLAAALALDGYVEAATGAIQVLGGMGFTWEHDAHVHLRRATTLRQLAGGTAPLRAESARLALAGWRRRLSIELPPEAEALRTELGALVAEIAAIEDPVDRHRALADNGLLAPHWPVPWGRDAGAVEQLVIDQVCAEAGLKRPNLSVAAWALPTIMAHGTPEQTERWVGPTLRGEYIWCQLFSEPGAGSDLAALSTRATRVDGGWSLTGQKVWTSVAARAHWGICLARTDPDVPKHRGITYFLVDMTSPGIEVRPLREITGHALFNEVFFDDCFVPDDCVVGEIDGGWKLARTTLANERVSLSSDSAFGGSLEGVLERVAGDGALQDPVTLDRLGHLLAEAQSLAQLGMRATLRSVGGLQPGPESSVRKLLGAEFDQRVHEFGLDICGPEGAVTEGVAAVSAHGVLQSRCMTIAGGTSEVQRNVIGERLLGLPRDPEPGR